MCDKIVHASTMLICIARMICVCTLIIDCVFVIWQFLVCVKVNEKQNDAWMTPNNAMLF